MYTTPCECMGFSFLLWSFHFMGNRMYGLVMPCWVIDRIWGSKCYCFELVGSRPTGTWADRTVTARSACLLCSISWASHAFSLKILIRAWRTAQPSCRLHIPTWNGFSFGFYVMDLTISCLRGMKTKHFLFIYKNSEQWTGQPPKLKTRQEGPLSEIQQRLTIHSRDGSVNTWDPFKP